MMELIFVFSFIKVANDSYIFYLYILDAMSKEKRKGKISTHWLVRFYTSDHICVNVDGLLIHSVSFTRDSCFSNEPERKLGPWSLVTSPRFRA